MFNKNSRNLFLNFTIILYNITMKYDDLNLISNHKNICLISHISPDTDALASMLVFRDFLISHFKISCVDMFSESESLSDNYIEMIGNLKLNKKVKQYDVAIMMDSPNTERLGVYKNLFNQAKLKIVIDHHQTNLFEGNINIVEQQSSTCEIVYSIIKHFKHKISIRNQSKIYAGIITDTNNFTVGNFNKKTFKIASEIIDNVDHEKIYSNFLGRNTMKNMQLLSIAINNIKSFNNDNIIISHITHDEATKLNACSEDFIGIVNKISTISNSLLVCFIYPKGDNYYVSLRAKQGLKVSSLAKANGGGGHDGASAYLSNKQLQEIENNVLDSFKNLLKKHRPKPNNIF